MGICIEVFRGTMARSCANKQQTDCVHRKPAENANRSDRIENCVKASPNPTGLCQKKREKIHFSPD